MYSPVFLSWPTTSGSPPVLSISLSDHSFSALASSFACTLAHSRPLWRFRFFSKRSLNALSSSSRCFGDNSFLLLLMLFILLLQVHRSTFLLSQRELSAHVTVDRAARTSRCAPDNPRSGSASGWRAARRSSGLMRW